MVEKACSLQYSMSVFLFVSRITQILLAGSSMAKKKKKNLEDGSWSNVDSIKL